MKTETLFSLDGPLGIPVEIVRQSFFPHVQRPTRRLAVVTGLHGDELEGLYLCHRLIKFLNELTRTQPEALRGEVHVYPAANPAALNHLTRLWPFHGTDMNRAMGQESASLPAAAARALLADIRARADLAVDIHASNLHLKELPQVRVPEEFAKKLVPLARHTNTDVVWVHPMAGLFNSTLGYNLNAAKIPTLVLEAGICLRIHPELGEQLFTGLVHLMKKTDILVPAVPLPGPVRDPWVLGSRQVALVTARRSGLFVARAALGSKVTRGDLLGVVIDPIHGTDLEEVTAPETGLLFTLREVPTAYSGTLLARIALEFEPEP